MTVELRPLGLANPPHARSLVWCENCKAQAKLSEQFEGFQIDSSLRQPHPFRRALESFFKVADAPDNLRGAVAAVRQRHDHMIVGLRDGGAMSRKVLAAFLIGRQDRGVNLRRLDFQPRQQGRAEVKTDLRVIIDEFYDAILIIQNARNGVGGVTLRGNPLVPIVIGRRRVLHLDGFKPGVFPRRLVEVAMNAYTPFHFNVNECRGGSLGFVGRLWKNHAITMGWSSPKWFCAVRAAARRCRSAIPYNVLDRS